jgi:hypothetical protein
VKLFNTAIVKSLVSPIPPVDFNLHILNPHSQHPVTLYGGSLSWLKERPTLEERGQWESTHAAIFRSYRRDLFRRLSYISLLADEVQVEQPLKKLQQGLKGRDVPSGIRLLPPDEERAVINSLAVHPEADLRVSLKRRIAKAFERTGRGGNALSSYVADREEWAGILDGYFMEAHEAQEGYGLIVNQALLGLYPTWLSDRIGDARMLKCVSLTVQFPLSFAECAPAVQECTRKVAQVLSHCRSSTDRPGLQFYKEILPEFSALQHEFCVAGPSVTITLMCVGDVRERQIRIPLIGLELYEEPDYELELRDGTTIHLTVPPWNLGQTIPPLEGDYEIKLVER